MSNEIAEIIYEALGATFEGLAFLEITPDESCTPPEGSEKDWLWSSVELKSPGHADISIVLPKSLVQEIVESLYMSDDEMEQRSKDLIGEMTNTLAGKLFAALHPGETFVLGMPVQGNGAMPPNREHPYVFLTDDDRKLAVFTDLHA